MGDWHIMEPLVVRMTGFPIETLTQLRFSDSTAVVRQILACETDIDELRQTLLEGAFQTAVSQAHQHEDLRPLLSSFSTWRRAVGRQRPLKLKSLPPDYASFYALLQQWNRLLNRHAQLLAQGRATWQAELNQRRQRLWQIAADPLVQEAIFLSSPGMYTALQRHLQGGKWQKRKSAVRQFERRLMTYWQRFCTKNETQSFFGPINYGQLETDQPANLHLRQSAAPLRERVVFPSFWMAEAIAAKMTAEEAFRPFLKPRRSSFCLLQGHDLFLAAAGKTVSLSPAAARLFHLADGSHTLAGLVAHFDGEPAQAMQTIARLEKIKALVVDIIIPGDISDPLAYLQDWLAEIPASLAGHSRWSGALSELRQMIADFASADLAQRIHLLSALEARFEEIGQQEARRGKGAMYVDRFLVFEECLGRLENFSVGGTLADAVQTKLKPILRLWHAYGRYQHRRDQQAAYAVWQAMADGGETAVSFLDYLHALSHYQAEPMGKVEGVAAFMTSLEQLIQARSDGHRACLQSAELPPLPLPPEADACDYCSVDLMIAAESQEALQAGQFQLILGEAHPQPLPWVFPTAYFWEDGGKPLAEALAAGLSAQPGGEMAAQVAFTRKSKIFPCALPGSMVELRPRYPDCRAIPVAAVQVRQKKAEVLRLWANDRWLRLYAPLTSRSSGVDPLAPFAFTAVQPFPIDLGQHTPRIEIDNIVYQREKWVLPTEPFRAWPERDFDLFLQTWRWKEQHALPDELFVRVPSEPKPVYIDLTNHFFVELLYHLSRQSDTLTISEMLPNTRQLWLQTEMGTHCCELRTMAIVK